MKKDRKQRQGRGRQNGRLRIVPGLVLLIWLLGTLFLFSPKLQAAEAFTLDDFHIEMVVRNNNAYEITETFTANFTEQRHGLIRSIPLRTYREGLAEITVVDANTEYSVQKIADTLEIRLGNKDKYVKGPVRYEITYIYDLGRDGLDDMDEIYFNLIGSDWDTTISNVSFHVIMPYPFSAAKLKFTSGPKGRTERAPLDLELSDTDISGQLRGRLGAHEALTMALPLPEGYFDGDMRSGLDPLMHKELWIYVGAAAAGILLRLILALSNRRPAAVNFYAPEGVNPADLDYLYSGRVTQQGLSALILHWVNLGYLAMEEAEIPGRFGRRKKELILLVQRPPDGRLKKYEQRLLQSLQMQADAYGRIYLSQLPLSFHEDFKRAMGSVAAYWQVPERRVYSSAAKVWSWVFRLLSLAVLYFALFRHATMYLSGTSLPPWATALLMTFLVYGVGVMKLGDHIGRLLAPGKKKLSFVSLLISLILYLGILALLALAAWLNAAPIRLLYIIVAYLVSTLPYILSQNIRLYTRYGKTLMTQVDGFVNFLRKTDRRAAAGFDANYFTFNMAYAYALNMAKEWTKTFSALMQEQTDAAQAAQWGLFAQNYLNQYDLRMNLVDLAVGRRPARSSSDSSSSESSGGSSSGGSSGGGSGGGGGRSW